MAAGPGNGTYDKTSNPTKLGGMGAGPTSTTGIFINSVWKGTSPYWLGKDTRQLAFTILVGSTGTGLESNSVKKIKSMMDSSINPKTMGHIMGYVGTSEQRAPLRWTGTTTNLTFCSQRSDSHSLHWRSSAATKRRFSSAAQPNQDNT